jgi:3-(methylsulfanyl)propanoyl-CoA dehydrogenase
MRAPTAFRRSIWSGRKLGRDGGRAITAFFNEVSAFARENAANEAMKSYTAPLNASIEDLQEATMWLMQNAIAKPDNAGASSTDFLHLFGLVTLGYMWARMAKVAQDKQASAGEQPYLKTKLLMGKFFMERMLPETSLRLWRIQAGAASMMELPAEAF